MVQVTRGLVLREVNYKERDKILTVLLEGQGKRTVKAAGCRGRSSNLAAAAQSLVWAEMTLFQYRDRLTLKEANTINPFRGVRDRLEKLALGSYFAEAVEAVADEGVDTPGLLPLVLNSLYALDRLDYPLAQVKAAFEMRLACLAGYSPLLDSCAVCGRANMARPMLSLEAGVIHCSTCREAALGRSAPLDSAALEALAHAAYGPSKRLFSFRLPPDSLGLLAYACENFLLTQLDRGFRTLDFYKSL